MHFNTKFGVKDRVYTDSHGRVISGLVSTVRCQSDRYGETISYDVWIDQDEKVSYEYWVTSDEKYLFSTAKEASDFVQEIRNLGGKGNGKV